MSQNKTVSGLPVLYSRRSDSGCQTWRIEVEGCQFRMISGTKNGAETASEWTVCKGKNIGAKNETSPEAQALKEAQSRWQKKVDSGYKVDEADIDIAGHFEPMLAHDYKKNIAVVTFPIYVQPKLDGMRCVARKDGLWSRNGKPILAAPHIFEAVSKLFEAEPRLVLDGELYADKLAGDFNKVISLAKKSKPTADELAESATHLEYHVYDLFYPHQPTMNFSERSRSVETFLRALDRPCLRVVPTILAGTQSELDEIYGTWLERGYEGQMLRLDTPYESKRTTALLKRKEFCDEEFMLVDVTEGKGNRSGMAGRCHFTTAAGVAFETGIRGNRDFYRRLLQEKEALKGKLCTVRYQNMTPGSEPKPRFGVVTGIRDYE